MSVSDSEKECPLCMEALDWDDLGFYPCSCGYQICRFCWHRLRTDENGLCPACRQAFPDIPVSFNPEISAEELKKQKRRNKDRKSNKDPVFKPQDLATLRVVQKNLVFVIGLSSRLTQEDLKKEFAHFGKIIKFVHNKSTAYITYSKPEEAIRAIRTLNASAAQESAAQQQLQMVNGTTTPTNLAAAVHQNNNIITNGTTTTFTTNSIPVPTPANRLKASLGTTKYCNHFLRSQQCPKVGECMYLHEIAEAEASFTKEQMQAGKHVEYEKKLMDSYVASLSQASPPPLPPSALVQQVPIQHQAQLQQIQPQSQAPPTQQQPQSHIQQQQAPQLQQAAQNNSTRHTSLLRHQIPQSQQPSAIQQQQQQQAHFQLLQHFQQQQHQHQQQQQALLHQNHNQSPLRTPPSPPSPPLVLQHQQLQQQRQHQQQQQLQQQQQQQHVSVESDSDDDGLDFDPISVSTSGLQDLLDQHAKQELQMHYLQQLTSSNQALANVLFPQNGRLNGQTTPTNRLLVDAFNGHPAPTLASLAGLDTSPSQQEPIVWPNLSTWNYLQRSGFGFENGR